MNSQNAELTLSRRDALKTFGAGAALLGLGLLSTQRLAAQSTPGGASPANAAGGPFMLPPPTFAYVTAANKALAGQSSLLGLEVAELLAQLEKAPAGIRTTLRNNVGGHANHTFFWTILSPKGGGEPKGGLESAIKKQFGDFATFKTQFGEAAAKRFGSGWAWLLVKDGNLVIESSANQDSPLMDGALPIVGLDVWEHAYYLKYQNKRADYVNAFWNVVDWAKADEYYRSAT